MTEERITRLAEAVNANPALVRELLCTYDWPNMDEHREWLSTAPDAEIASWLRSLGREVLDESTIFEETAN